MKNYIIITSLFFVQIISAQTTIGKKASPTNSSVLLEFTNTNKGIIVPYTSGVLSTAVDGTFIFDTIDKKLKFKQNGIWLDLSNTAAITNAVAQPGGTDDSTKKTVMGAKSSTADGALVLESTTKLMVLPQVTDPYKNIVNPSAGLMVYDPINDALCTFNGTEWTFWTYP